MRTTTPVGPEGGRGRGQEERFPPHRAGTLRRKRPRSVQPPGTACPGARGAAGRAPPGTAAALRTTGRRSARSRSGAPRTPCTKTWPSPHPREKERRGHVGHRLDRTDADIALLCDQPVESAAAEREWLPEQQRL